MSIDSDDLFINKVAFVTGTGSGMGCATVPAFARADASVTMPGHTERNVEETADLIGEKGGQVVTVKCDVRRTEDVQAAHDTDNRLSEAQK